MPPTARKTYTSPDGETGTVPYRNEKDEGGILTGKSKKPQIGTTKTGSWVERRHPSYAELCDDERRQRASFVATRRALAPFLVPHRFEGPAGKTKGAKLPRARLGYGLRLNQPFVTELFGHIRSTGAQYSWGKLDTREGATTDGPEAPSSPASALWLDATGKNVSWKTFFERTILEWLCTSPGGAIVVDSRNSVDGVRRPRLTFCPTSWIEDFKEGDTGLEWIRFAEAIDERGPKDDVEGFTHYHVLYELRDGETIVSRYDDEGDPVLFDGEEERSLGSFVDLQGEPRLPIVVVGYGEHEFAPLFGAGLLQGLDDIVIDLYNQMSETRESFRDASFGIVVHKGPGGELVQKKVEKGTRFLTLGDHEGASLERLAGESSEVSNGLALLQSGLEAWRLSARRKVAEAMERATQSGVSIKAEFQLDSRPLLVELTERLDEIESQVMRVVAQMAEVASSAEQLMEYGVSRETEFNLEDEGDRILRVVESAIAVFNLPAELKVRLAMRWVESTGMLDLDEEVEQPEVPGAEEDEEDTGEPLTLREVIETGFRALADSADREVTQRAAFTFPPVGGGSPFEL